MAETTEPQFILRSTNSSAAIRTHDPDKARRLLCDVLDTDNFKVQILTTDTVKVFGHQEEVKVSQVMSAREFLESYSE